MFHIRLCQFEIFSDQELGDCPAGRGEIISDHYYLLPADLRDLKDLDTALAKAKLDFK